MSINPISANNLYTIKAKSTDGGSADNPDAGSASTDVQDVLPPAGTSLRDASTTPTAASSNNPSVITREEALLEAGRNRYFLLSERGRSFNDDREIVLIAVRQYGIALSYASDRLRGDEEVALAAVEQNPGAFGFAAESLKADERFMRRCFEKRFYSYQYMTNPPSDLTAQWQNIRANIKELKIPPTRYLNATLIEIREIINTRMDVFFAQYVHSLPASLTSLTREGQESLLREIPEAMRTIIQELLGQKFKPCDSPSDLPDNCFETVLNTLGIDFSPETSGITSEALNDMEFLTILGSANFNLEHIFAPFVTERDDTGIYFTDFDANVLPQMLESLIPGDVLLFGYYTPSRETGRYATHIHSAIYLGEYDNKHYIFQKPDQLCDQVSPYEIYALEDYLYNKLGRRIPLYSFDTVFVYRQQRSE